jgi:hypothetical protein
MSRQHLILPQADPACGKIFFPDRRTADGHRIALEVWNWATGRVRDGYQLAVHRCKRCGGFHVSHLPVDRIRSHPQPIVEIEPELDEPESWDDWDEVVPRVRRVSLPGAARC